MTQEQFLDLLTEWMRMHKQNEESSKVSMDTELLGSGLLDSFDFLDLILYIETKSGHKIDLAIADPNEFSVVRGLWNLAA
jgi:acyl carrier protein